MRLRIWLCITVLTLASRLALGSHHPHDVIDAYAVSPDFANDRTVFLASAGSIRLFLKSVDGGLSWEDAAHGIGGRTATAFAFASDWKSSGTAYVATSWGLYRTEDRGSSWQPLAGRPLQLALPPVSADGTQEIFYASQNELFHSEDDGESFTKVPSLPPIQGKISSIAISPSYHDDQTIALSAIEPPVVYLSQDGGTRWRALSASAPVVSTRFSPGDVNGSTLWLASHGAGVLRATAPDYEVESRWAGPVDMDVNDVAVAPRFAETPHLLAATRDAGVFQSLDGGATWNHLPLEVTKTYQTDNHYREVSFSPGYPEEPHLFCGTYEGFYVSDDSGVSWRESAINPTRIGRRVTFSPGYDSDRTMFRIGYGQQPQVSNDAGISWSRCPILGLSAYSIALAPTFLEEPIVLAGPRGLRRSLDGGQRFEVVSLPTVLEREYATYDIAFSTEFKQDRTVFAISGGGELFRSSDGANRFESLGVKDRTGRQVAVSPGYARDATVFFAGNWLYRSEDRGETATRLLSGLAPSGLTLAPDYESSGEVFVVSLGKGLLKSTDRGTTWSSCREGLETFFPAALSLSPDYVDDHTIYLGTLGGGLFRSPDRGAHWQRVTPLGSPVDSCHSLSLSPSFSKDKTILLGNFAGTWKSEDAGQSWVQLDSSEFIDETRDPWIRSKGWKSRRVEGTINQSVYLTSDSGESLTLPFQGVGVRVFGLKGSRFGQAEMWLDRALVDTIDCFQPGGDTPALLWERSDLDEGPHSLEIRVKESGAGGKNRYFAVDAAQVLFRPAGIWARAELGAARAESDSQDPRRIGWWIVAGVFLLVFGVTAAGRWRRPPRTVAG